MAQFQCLLCGTGNPLPVSNKDAKTGQPLVVVRCLNCGFVSQMDIPSGEELRVYYSHNYRADYKSVYEPKLKHVYRAGAAATKRLAFLERSGIVINGKSILDIGAGGGEFVFLASTRGGLAQGIEPNEGYSQFAKREYGVDVQTAMLDDVNIGGVDIITMFHVLEHIADPKVVLEKLWGLLNENGILFIEVPNILQNDASPKNIFFKAHLHYFSSSSLAAFASPWFSCERVVDDGNLLMLLRKRESKQSVSLPSPSDIEFIETRLNAKGWFEYLFVGGGWKKAFKRLGSRYKESQLSGAPRQLLLDNFGHGSACKGGR